MHYCYLKVFIVVLLIQVIGNAQRITQDIIIMQYFESRIAMLEDRLIKCDQDIMKYVQELYAFSKEMRARLDGLGVYRTEFRSEVESVVSRVERIEHDIDYLENQSPVQPCVEIDDRLLEQQVKKAQGKKADKLKLGTDCDAMLTSIKSIKIVKKAGDVHGSWMKDPSKSSPKIYFFSGTKNTTLLEFPNIKEFTESNFTQVARNVTLPFPWQGTGHVVYNGFLYFHKSGSLNEIIKFHIRNRTVTDSMLLPGAGRVPVYQLSPFTFIDLAIDELGLWSIHADPDTGRKIVITKIDRGSLSVEHSWDTSCSSEDAEAAFLICGTLYVVYNSRYGGRSRIQCLYDIHDMISNEESQILYFPKRYGSHSVMHYNPKEKQIYSWDDGYQTIYRLVTKQKNEGSLGSI
ncbi:olfactomedin-like protein 3A [Lepisosteus oculatus]|uniref:olfactomedin-like protein 3A n=1 Tax=Lepisosteus oculatus TaxID=7918 RepID=UPI0035F522D9